MFKLKRDLGVLVWLSVLFVVFLFVVNKALDKPVAYVDTASKQAVMFVINSGKQTILPRDKEWAEWELSYKEATTSFDITFVGSNWEPPSHRVAKAGFSH